MSYTKPKLVNVHWWTENSKSNNWIPVSSGVFPEEGVIVQVTFIGYHDKLPHSEAFAYREFGEWYWAIEEEKAKAPITAWKRKCEPYKGE